VSYQKKVEGENMSEIWDLYDINKNKTGIQHERGKESLIPEDMYHLVVEIWTKNKEGKILLTQRHPNKKNGLKWECTGGSVLKGEDSIDGAIREMQEETGIRANKYELKYLGETIKTNYILDTYLYQSDIDIKELCLQPEEVVDAKYVEKKDIYIMHKNGEIAGGAWQSYCQFTDYI